jgi:mannose-6-phosphate isomerase-like protein (cupin superfamily)
MADYTLKNLKEDVADAAPQFGLSDTLEAHFAREQLELGNAGISYQHLAPNTRLPFGHKHEEQEEVYVIVGGSGRIKLDDEVVELKKWDALRIGPDTMRNVEAGSEGLELIAFGSPHSGTNDAEMTQDWWGDD